MIWASRFACAFRPSGCTCFARVGLCPSGLLRGRYITRHRLAPVGGWFRFYPSRSAGFAREWKMKNEKWSTIFLFIFYPEIQKNNAFEASVCAFRIAARAFLISVYAFCIAACAFLVSVYAFCIAARAFLVSVYACLNSVYAFGIAVCDFSFADYDFWYFGAKKLNNAYGSFTFAGEAR